jgi:Flp pilus assembly protein TadB
MSETLIERLLNPLANFAARLDQTTIVLAFVAAAGALLAWLGLTSVRRISLAEEAARIRGIRQPTLAERLQAQIDQSGVRIGLRELVLTGLLLGAALSAPLAFLGYFTAAALALVAGPLGYWLVLMRRRDARLREFREALPDAIDDCADHIAVYRSVRRAVEELAAHGPLPLRPIFSAVLVEAGTQPLAAALAKAGSLRSEVFYRQFLDALANAETKGGDVREVLQRIASAQRVQNALHRRIYAKQASGRLIGLMYGIAPTAFLVFFSIFGGQTYQDFFRSAAGQVAQVFVVLSGALTWWLTGRIAGRGLHMGESPMSRLEGEGALLSVDQPIKEGKAAWTR